MYLTYVNVVSKMEFAPWRFFVARNSLKLSVLPPNLPTQLHTKTGPRDFSKRFCGAWVNRCCAHDRLSPCITMYCRQRAHLAACTITCQTKQLRVYWSTPSSPQSSSQSSSSSSSSSPPAMSSSTGILTLKLINTGQNYSRQIKGSWS